MGQTILDEYLASLDEENDNNLPDPKQFGFNSIAAMLTEASEVMENQAETNSYLRAKVAELHEALDYLRFFHSNADFGPAHTDVVMAIQAAYEKTGKQVPTTWKYE